MVKVGPLFRQHSFSTADISHTLYTFRRNATKMDSVRDLSKRHLFPEFGELWSGVP